MDFHPGGDLATQLARWGRLGRDRARFYAAEIVEGVEGLHAAGVIYRDLKPENILIGADGHIVLTDFGLSKEFPRRRDAVTAPSTPSAGAQAPWMKDGAGGAGDPASPASTTDMTTTFCGTAEYLAPEVIQALPYSYEIDWWSFGTMLYEMLTGITPFWANNHSDMYVRVLQDELQFPDDRAMDQDTKSLIRGLLQRNPALRICEPRIKKHPYFSMIDWSHVFYKRYIPPYIPPIDPSNASDTQNFDDTFLDMEPVLDDADNDNENGNNTDTDQDQDQDLQENTDTDRTDGEETNTTPSQSRSSSIHPTSRKSQAEEDDSVDVFDGYSFKGRHSVLIDDEEDQEEEESEEEETDEEEEEEDVDISSAVLGDLSPPPPTATVPVAAEVPVEIQGEAEEEEEEELPEPKTPEARPKALPDHTDDVVAPPTATPSQVPSAAPPSEVPATVTEVEAKPRKSKELSSSESSVPAPPLPDKPKPAAPPAKTQPAKGHGLRPPPRRKERSGVPALDRYLSDGPDETEVTERDDEDGDEDDDDWDFIEADGGEDRNGAKGTSLFARGVVDRYRLAVFRKASTPSR
ncbi:kinase-like protein [Gymnopus androsaceus JB14]|uniref:Kinase-like protein n=1 Tax=Gymnopus androsaceus JB14 TaxID=1447944 RepID=A0A6A4H6C5_9AGAR|nr:kinase-like protein [Gymnopus androsaceus JB14]